MLTVPLLALDGPSGAGKGTVGQRVADKLGWRYLDSGAIYRALAWLAAQENVSPSDTKNLVALVGSMQFVCHVNLNDVADIEVNGHIVTKELRTEAAGEMASKIAPIAEVRAALLGLQRAYLKLPGLVADGRDMGTVVFPEAPKKVFLTASAEVRAERRLRQLQDKGIDVTLAPLLKSIQERDVRDASRAESPLKPADDALLLDSSDLTINQVVSRILDFVKTS